MTTVTVIFIDIVEFSKKPTWLQSKIIKDFNDAIHKALTLLKLNDLSSPSIAGFPTGDGLALSFSHSDVKQLNQDDLLAFLYIIKHWGGLYDDEFDGKIEFRMGVHFGGVEVIQDFNGSPNFVGDTMNYCQRIMDAADPQQVLISDAAAKHYFGFNYRKSISIRNPEVNEATIEFEISRQIQVIAKHKMPLTLHVLKLVGTADWWQNCEPTAKNLMTVQLTPLPKDITGDFAQQLHNARHIALVQLTGVRLLSMLKSHEIILKESLLKFWVFMPNPEDVTIWDYDSHRTSHQNIEEWKTYLQSIQSEYPHADIRLGLFKSAPYYAASYLDWEYEGGVIHVSPYIWGVGVSHCPGYDSQWLGENPPPVYAAYMKGINWLRQNAEYLVKS